MPREHGQTDEQQQVEDAPGCERNGIAEEQGEVLGPSLKHGSKAAVHARGDGLRRVAEAQSELATLDDVGQFHVFEDGVLDGFMSTNAEVGLAANEQKLSVGSCEAGFGI